MRESHTLLRKSRLLYTVTGAIIAAGLFGVTAMVQANPAGAGSDVHDLAEENDAQKPNEISTRTGIPMLTSFETPAVADGEYYSIKQGQYDYLDRAVAKGTTLISIVEMDEYFKTFSDNGYRFAVESKDGSTGYFTINFFEPPLSLERHNVLVSVTDNLDESAKVLPAADARYLSDAIDRPFRWVQIDDNAASALKSRIATDGNDFNAATQYGDRTVRVMYIGPFSEELERPEFQAMYGQAAGGQ